MTETPPQLRQVHGTKDRDGRPLTVDWRGQPLRVVEAERRFNIDVWAYEWAIRLESGAQLFVWHMLSSGEWYLKPDDTLPLISDL